MREIKFRQMVGKCRVEPLKLDWGYLAALYDEENTGLPARTLGLGVAIDWARSQEDRFSVGKFGGVSLEPSCNSCRHMALSMSKDTRRVNKDKTVTGSKSVFLGCYCKKMDAVLLDNEPCELWGITCAPRSQSVVADKDLFKNR